MISHLNFKKLQFVGEGNGNPLWLSCRPLQLVNFRRSQVYWHWIDSIGSSKRGQLPNECLWIIPSWTNMTGTLGSPRNGIDTSPMPLQLRNRHCWRPYIQYDDLITIHQNGSHVPHILLVPGQSKQWSIRLGALVYDCRVLLIPQIENSHWPISGNRGENPCFTPSNVVHLLIVGNQLGFYNTPLHVPDGTSGVDAGCPNSPRLDLVPIEGC